MLFLHPPESTINLSFREKTLWLMAAGLVLGFGLYFAFALPGRGMDVRPEHVVAFLGVVVLLVVAQIVGSVMIAVVDRRTETDERDRLIELKGTRNASFVLATGVFLSLCAALFTEGNFLFTHLLLGFWVLAQLVEIASQLVLHRRGA